MQLLNRQIAVVNFEPLRGHFMALYTGAQTALPGLNAMPSMRSWLQRNAAEKNPEKVCCGVWCLFTGYRAVRIPLRLLKCPRERFRLYVRTRPQARATYFGGPAVWYRVLVIPGEYSSPNIMQDPA